MESVNSNPTATIVAKVIRADGTEETFVSDDVSVKDAKALSDLLSDFRQTGERTVSAEEVAQRNAEESARNEAANRAQEKGGK